MSVILFRKQRDTEEELSYAESHCHTVKYRTECPPGSLVYGRYSVMPYYRELDEELRIRGSRLINTYGQHKYIADFDYYYDVAEYTFESWFDLSMTRYNGPFIVKGQTNSRKHLWSTAMYAEDKRRAVEIARDLRNDGLIGDQRPVFRKYEPLKTLEIGVNGVPFANEWRLFYLGKKRISQGFYWSGVDDLDDPRIQLPGPALELADLIAAIVSQKVNFFVLDIAEKADGSWVLVEVNDAQMSGLSLTDPGLFYYNLAEAMREFKLPSQDSGLSLGGVADVALANEIRPSGADVWEPISPKIPVDAIGPLEPIEVLYEYDCEWLTFVAADTRGRLLLAHCLMLLDKTSRYLVSAINDRILNDLKSGKMDLRSGLCQSRCWIADLFNGGTIKNLWAVGFSSIPEDFLPKMGAMLYPADDKTD